MQAAYTGSSDDYTLREAFNAYQLFKNRYEAHVGPLSAARVLDFGCGWGVSSGSSYGKFRPTISQVLTISARLSKPAVLKTAGVISI